MSSPPTVRQDAFISYTHDNNQPLDQDGNGWIDNFHQHLEVQLIQFAGRKVAIWRDPQMPGNAALRKSLKERINEAVALIAVLSPGYIASKWCMGELREFCALAQETSGLHLNGRSRIFAVVKIPPDGNYPQEIEDQLRYEFFETNSKTKRPDWFRPDIKNRDERYWLKLQELAWDLKELLREMGRLPAPVAPETNPFGNSSQTPKKTIYLAETTAELAEQRRQIKEELLLHGYNVLPKQPLPYVLDEYCKEVEKALTEAEASINLLGSTDGLIPEGTTDRSIIRLQLDLANECASRRSRFTRLIWMPEGWTATDHKFGEMLQGLKLLADPHQGIEFLQTSLEEFKTLMHKRLTASLNGYVARSVATVTGVDLRKVYVICDRRDVSEAKPLICYLQRRYEVVLPDFEESDDETSLADIHKQNLLECDGVIVFWGHGNSRWVNSKRADIERHAGLEKTEASPRIRSLRAKAFYVTSPFDDLKDVFNPPRAHVIKNFGAFDPDLLVDFIKDLEDGDDNQGGNSNV